MVLLPHHGFDEVHYMHSRHAAIETSTLSHPELAVLTEGLQRSCTSRHKRLSRSFVTGHFE